MERLLFTDGVAKVYGMFKVNDEPFMIMEKGETDLATLNKAKFSLSDAQIIDASKRFIKLIDAQKKLNIVNDDIKPENLIVTADGRVVVIDISGLKTKGIPGEESELLARSLLENHRGLDLRGGVINLIEYFHPYRKDERDKIIASPFLLGHWARSYCRYFVDPVRCSSVNNFEDLFAILPKPSLLTITTDIDKKFENSCGTTDCFYGTHLLKPNIQEISDADWEKYFEMKDIIGEKFCSHMNVVDEYSDFFSVIKNKYSSYCKEINGEGNNKSLVFEKKFISSSDPEFHAWIKDALSPDIKSRIFELFAGPGIRPSLFRSIFEDEYDAQDPVGVALLKLYDRSRNGERNRESEGKR